jgi:cell division protein ZapA
MNDDGRSVRVANVQLQFSAQVDRDLLQRAADIVNARMAAIEEKAERIDTQRFALRAAVQLAVELEQLRQEREEEDRELLQTLDRLNATLRNLAEELDQEQGEE